MSVQQSAPRAPARVDRHPGPLDTPWTLTVRHDETEVMPHATAREHRIRAKEVMPHDKQSQ